MEQRVNSTGKLAKAAAMTSALLLASTAQAFTIADNGKANASIVIAKDAPVSATAAANELAKYFKSMSGADFVVSTNDASTIKGNRIIIGSKFNKSDAKPDEISISFADSKTLVLTGEGTRGPIYAAYHLLEHFGCGFWAPDNETVPKLKTLTLPGDFAISEAPAFEYRQPYGESCNNPQWNVKIGVNGNIWAKAIPESLGGSYSVDLSQSMAGFKGKDYFEAHPEWFAWREKKQKRVVNQVCTHNDEVMAEIIRLAREMLKKNPNRPYISVSMGDNGEFCECEKCKELVAKEASPTALIINGANKVARALAKDYPNVRIVFLAYWITERPPLTLKLEPNVTVCYAMLDRDHGKPPSATPRHDIFLRQWNKLSDGNIIIWGYNAQFHNFLLPTPSLDLLGPEFRLYKENGVKGVFSQLPWGSLADFVDLRCWLFAKLAWNPYQNEWDLIEQWLNGACGKGAPYMKEYLKLLTVIRSRQKNYCYSVYQNDSRSLMSAKDLFQAKGLFEKAIEATKGDPRANAQVRQQYASIVMVMATRYNNDIAPYAKANNIKIPTRDEVINELDALRAEFKCGTYCEWAPLTKFIAKLRQGEVLEAYNFPPREKDVIVVAPNEMSGAKMTVEKDVDGTPYASLKVDSKTMGFPFMEQDKGAIYWNIPEKYAGRWKVLVTVRSGATIPDQVTAYLGIYNRNTRGEISRAFVRTSPGATGWETIDLGTYEMPAMARIWVVPGVIANADFIDVKSIVLINPDLLD